MFLRCSLFGDNAALETMELNDLKYDAALVLWKRDEEDDDKIKFHEAISFGTKPLTDAHKAQYETNGGKMLPSVNRNNWSHLEKNENNESGANIKILGRWSKKNLTSQNLI